MLSIPNQIQIAIIALLEEQLTIPITLQSFSFASGGCINNGGRLKTSAGTFFVKWNDALKFPGMFDTEAKGLNLLASVKAVHIPVVFGQAQTNQEQFIVMEFIERGLQSKNYWIDLGQQLAQLHRNTNKSFGLDHQNYIGSLKQFNNYNQSWIKFFIEQRLAIQVKLAVDTGKADNTLMKKFERLYHLLPALLPEEKPALLHGDLWTGNIITNKNGQPCLIDPAVYYGNREIELAFTKLFGGFDNLFYTAYQDVFPLQPNFNDRIDIYNLYPLLVHVNLFGGHYLSQVTSIVNSVL